MRTSKLISIKAICQRTYQTKGLELVLTESLKLKHLGYAHLESLHLIHLQCDYIGTKSAQITVHSSDSVKKGQSLESCCRTTR
jgi:hypothetical protein